MHVDFHIPYVYDYMTKLRRRQAKIMKMKMFAILDKAKHYTENIRGLNLAAVTCAIFQVS
jgi:hypothetical protein